MLRNLNNPYPFIDELAFHLRLILWISLGMFLFVLFFQPVDIAGFDFNNKLMVIAGYGGITFIILSLNQIVFPSIFPGIFLKGKWSVYKEIILQLITWAMLAVAFNFYSRYVGRVIINFDISFRIILTGLLPMLLLVVATRFKIIRHKLATLEEKAVSAGLLEQEKTEDHSITFDSENKSEDFTINLSQLILIQSANNYIEVFFVEEEETKKKLIRSTLKRAEELLKPYSKILRCHRTTLVNASFVLGLSGTPGNLKLKMLRYEDGVPVSRQYLLGVREALKGSGDK